METNKVKLENSNEESMDVDNSHIKEERKDVKDKDDLLKSKQEWISQFAKLLCSILQPLIPNLSTDRSSGLMFYLDDLKPCSDTNMLADTLYVFRRADSDSKEAIFKCYENYSDTFETNLTMHTDIARRIYERMMKFILLYDNPLRNPHIPQTMWKCFTVRVNSEGESLMEIQSSFADDTGISMLINKEFNSDEAKDCNLRTLVITHAEDQSNTHVVFGMPHIVEKIWDMNFTVNGSYLTMWNPVAMRNLSETLCSLIKPNKNETGLLLFDTLSAVPAFYLANACKTIVWLHSRDEVKNFITSEASRNGIQNLLNFNCPKGFFRKSLSQDFFSQCSEVCLVICALNRIIYKDVPWISRNDEKISRVIIFVTLDTLYSVQKLTNFLDCYNVKDPLVITRVVPVDMSPFENKIQLLILLERSSVIQVIPNSNFSADIFTRFRNVIESVEQIKGPAPEKRKRMPETILDNLSATLQVVDEISNKLLLKKAQLQATDQTSNTLALSKEKLQVAGEVSQGPPSTNSNITNEEKEKISIVVNKETVQNFKEEKDSTELIDSKSEEMSVIMSYKISDADKVFLKDLNESQKMIMTQIIKELDDCDKLNVDEMYQTAVNVKRERANFEAKRLSDVLIPVLPLLVNRTSSDFAFEQLDMVPCPSTETLSEKYFIILERSSITGKIVNTLNSTNKMIPLQRTLSNKAKTICKMVAMFILKSKYPVFNKQGQGFWCMIIRINSKGKPWILVEGNVDIANNAKKVLSDLEPKLKLFITTGIVAKIAPDVKNVFLSIFTRTDAEARVVLGNSLAYEQAGPFGIRFHGKKYPYYHPLGMMGLASELLKLAAVDKNWGMVQVGCGCGIESLHLAKECAEYHLLRQPGTLNIYFFAKENGVKNFVYNPVNNAKAMESVIVKDMARHSNVCVLYDLSEPVGFFGASVLRNNLHVKRIIYVIDLKNNEWIKEVVACCQNKTDWKEPFVVTKFAAVDMATYEDNVRVICVLERESSVQPNLRPNYAFSEKAAQEFLSG